MLSSGHLFLEKVTQPELSTGMLLALMADYADPRGRIHDLTRNGLVRPVKRGIYLAKTVRGMRPYSTSLLANMIYGPSYVSLESALSTYGFVPEKVETITSVCFGQSRAFTTPVGTFEYCHVDREIYPHGVALRPVDAHTSFLCATPEKALLDFIHIRESAQDFRNAADFFAYAFDSHRLDLHTISEAVSIPLFQSLSTRYKLKKVDWFASELIRRIAK